jgi:hypothetical protein
VKVRLWDDLDPDSLTTRVPVAFTAAPDFFTPCSFSFPALSVRVTVVVFVCEMVIRPLGRADVAPPANDHWMW